MKHYALLLLACSFFSFAMEQIEQDEINIGNARITVESIEHITVYASCMSKQKKKFSVRLTEKPFPTKADSVRVYQYYINDQEKDEILKGSSEDTIFKNLEKIALTYAYMHVAPFYDLFSSTEE